MRTTMKRATTAVLAAAVLSIAGVSLAGADFNQPRIRRWYMRREHIGSSRSRSRCPDHDSCGSRSQRPWNQHTNWYRIGGQAHWSCREPVLHRRIDRIWNVGQRHRSCRVERLG